MGELIPFRRKPKKEDPTPTSKPFRIFEEISKVWGADFDKFYLTRMRTRRKN